MASRPWRTFAMISIDVFASLLDLFIVNIAFPDLQRDFTKRRAVTPGLPELTHQPGFAILPRRWERDRFHGLWNRPPTRRATALGTGCG
jgi:hypothetical protein